MQEKKGTDNKQINDLVKINTALISVTDKSRLDVLLKGLFELNPDLKIISSGGTAKKIRELGYRVKDVSEYTGFAESPDGLVKTLHPKVHGGFLCSKSIETHKEFMDQHGIEEIDLLVSNLYPFENVTAEQDVDIETARQNIDIGGPSMLRSAAKNFLRVTVLTEPRDYERFLTELKANNCMSTLKQRYECAKKVFKRVEEYNKAIVKFFESRSYDELLK